VGNLLDGSSAIWETKTMSIVIKKLILQHIPFLYIDDKNHQTSDIFYTVSDSCMFANIRRGFEIKQILIFSELLPNLAKSSPLVNDHQFTYLTKLKKKSNSGSLLLPQSL
jgi:hypothetical protein